MSKRQQLLYLFVIFTLMIAVAGCGSGGDSSETETSDKAVIQNAGSDTMVNLAQAWAEEYANVQPTVSVEVSGGGSGTGIAALINGTVDIANCSRQMKASEIERAKANTGKTPVELIVGYDALAVYVHEENPMNEISIEQLANIYGEGGNITKWSQLGISHSTCSGDEVIRISRQSNSGTYHYFREALLGNTADFKLGSRDLHGSKDVVELVEKTPCAIGYSGMGYRTDHVKVLDVAKKAGEQAFSPNVDNALSGDYPIARPLYIYSLGEATGKAKEYLDWILSAAGQKIVSANGYVPLETGAPMTESSDSSN